MTLSKHAVRRMSQRGITDEAIDFTLRWGKIYHRTGIVFFVLRQRDIRRSKRRDAKVQRWEGTTILMSEDMIVSVYKNRDISDIRRKGKQDLAAFYGNSRRRAQRTSPLARAA